METMNEELQAIAQIFYKAVYQVMHGDVAPMLALWSESNDVTYCDPYGGFHKGHNALAAYWQNAAYINSQSPGSVSVVAELMMAQKNNELVYSVMTDHIQLRKQDQILQQKALATNIYRYEGQHWRMLHRHSGSVSEEE